MKVKELAISKLGSTLAKNGFADGNLHQLILVHVASWVVQLAEIINTVVQV